MPTRLVRARTLATRVWPRATQRPLRQARVVPNMPTPQHLPGAAPKAPATVPSSKEPLLDGVSPAMCAMQLTPLHEKRKDFDQWLLNGREALSDMLSTRRAPSSVPSSRLLLGSSFADPESQRVLDRCFQWIHVPSVDGIKPDLVTIIFTRETDLAAWRCSSERATWLAAGESLARKDDAHDDPASSGFSFGEGGAVGAASIIKDAHSISFTRDDGSLGGWLPGSSKQAGGSQTSDGAPEAPPTYVVSATVLCAMYPMQEINRLVLMPSLDALSPTLWGGCSPSVQLFVACAFAAGGTTFVLLPYARVFAERVGWMGAGRSPLRASPAMVVAYVALIGAGLTASAVAESSWHVERLGKLTPYRGQGVAVDTSRGDR